MMHTTMNRPLLVLVVFALCVPLALSVALNDDTHSVGPSVDMDVPVETTVRADGYSLSGEERKHITSKGWTEIGAITLIDSSYLDATDISIIKFIGEINLYDNSVFEIYSKEMEIHADIYLYDNAKILFSTPTTNDDHMFLIDGTVNLYNNATIDVMGVRGKEDFTNRITFNKRMHFSNNNSFNLSNVVAQWGAPVTVHNTSKISITEDSHVTWNPGIDLGIYEPVLFMGEESNLTVDDSEFYLNPPNWSWNPHHEDRYNSSYVMTDGNSRLYVNHSHFSAILPGNVLEEYYHVTAGTLLVTGTSEWKFVDSTVYDELNYTQYLWVVPAGNNS